jgi:hypothetical protein
MPESVAPTTVPAVLVQEAPTVNVVAEEQLSFAGGGAGCVIQIEKPLLLDGLPVVVPVVYTRTK